MLKEHKNHWLEIIEQSLVDIAYFQYQEKQWEFTIELRSTPLKFSILQDSRDFDVFSVGYTEFRPGFPFRNSVWGFFPPPEGVFNAKPIPKTGTRLTVDKALRDWLKSVAQRYLTEQQAPDLWEQLQNYTFFADSETISKEDLQHFTKEEKKQIRLGLRQYKRLLVTQLTPTKEQQTLINERLDYLTEAVERLNRFDWKALAASTLVGIAVNLAVDVETGKQLFGMFMQAIGLITGHFLPPKL